MRIRTNAEKGDGSAVIDIVIETNAVWFDKGMHIAFEGLDICCRIISKEMYDLIVLQLIEKGFANLHSYTFRRNT